MKHNRSDYNRIQDPDGIIPEDEPVFLIRGQDIIAPEILEVWAMMNKLAGGDSALTVAASEQAHFMRVYQSRTGRCKPADGPHQPMKTSGR